MGIFNRKTGVIADDELYHDREGKAGVAALDALVAFQFPEGEPESAKELAEELSKLS